MNKQNLRMIEWLLLAIVFYALALAVGIHQLETLFWKLGGVTVGVFMGYWADRVALGRVVWDSGDLRKVARAIIVLACVYGVSGGI